MNDYYKSERYDPMNNENDDDNGRGKRISITRETKEEKLQSYVKQLLVEKLVIDQKQCPFAYKYICEEINRVQQGFVKGPPRDTRYIDMYYEKPVKVAVKVLFPLKEFPTFNFIGKLLGPKGSTLKQLQEETKCFMNICGRGSMRDREKEEELRRSLDPKYSHLSDEQHIEISTLAPPTEAHNRIAFALSQVRKHIIPDSHQPDQEEGNPVFKKSIFGKVNMPNPDMEDDVPRRHPGYPEERLQHSARPTSRPMPRQPIGSNTSVMSILNKARIAMAESHSVLNKRRPMHQPQYDDYDDGDRKYSSYGNDIHDVGFKKRKM